MRKLAGQSKVAQRQTGRKRAVDARQKWKWIKRIRSDYRPQPVSIQNTQGKPLTKQSKRKPSRSAYRQAMGPPSAGVHRPT